MRMLYAASLIFATMGLTQAANIIGIVSDPSARFVVSATVQARNMDTGAVFEAETNSTGHYRLVNLPSGTYEISISLPQFEGFSAKDVRTEDLHPARVDIVLKPR
jgi:hypothetical protein